MRFRPDDPPAGKQANDDPFAEFPLEPATGTETPKNRDWLAEFPDEKTVQPTPRSKNWTRLSDSLKDENG